MYCKLVYHGILIYIRGIVPCKGCNIPYIITWHISFRKCVVDLALLVSSGRYIVTMLWIVPLQPSILYHTSRTWLLAKNQQRSWQREAIGHRSGHHVQLMHRLGEIRYDVLKDVQKLLQSLPSGNGWHSYWKWPFIVEFPIKNVIFHSYVSLPEGTWCDVQVRQGGLGDLNIELWLTGRVLFLQQEIACDGDTCLIIWESCFWPKSFIPVCR